MRGIVLATSVALSLCAVAWAAPAPSPAAIPDFAGIWWHPSLPGPEPLDAGPTSLKNLMRRKEDGASDYNQLVGDYKNPILKPETAATVKKFGEMSLAGIVFPSPANQCWPEPGPAIYKNFALQIFQRGDHLLMIYDQDHELRTVRMNQPHPKNLKPSWYGDSVGHYEGDTLVIDTVGIRTDRPFPMIDLYGTPYTKSLHMVERYRLVDYEDAKEGLERDRKENFRAGVGTIDRNYRGKHLQVYYTVEDQGVFTMPWSGTVTYGRGSDEWPEVACAENPHVFYSEDEKVPTAAKPDF
jgi:hypothetical protein